MATEPITRRKNRGNKGATVISSPAAIARWERDLKCVELRKTGMHWQDIASALGYSNKGNAYHAFMKVMKEYPREDIEAVRNLISDRYDALIEALWPKAIKGDTWSIDRITRICDQQARLLGANRPEKLELSAGASELDAALRELETELKARAAGTPVPQE